jgi:hypothetical protein
MEMVSSTVGWSTMTGWNALQRRVLLDVLLVLVEGRRPDAVELAARQRGLSRLLASMAPSAAPAPTTVCSFVDERG